MRKFKCVCGYRILNADSHFYKGQIYSPLWSINNILCFEVEETIFHIKESNPLFRGILKEINSFKYGK
jgi:hypothetical protein